MAAGAERTVPPAHGGRALVTPEHPARARPQPDPWSRRADGELTAAALAGIADRLQADLPHRYVEFCDEGTADRLRARARGRRLGAEHMIGCCWRTTIRARSRRARRSRRRRGARAAARGLAAGGHPSVGAGRGHRRQVLAGRPARPGARCRADVLRPRGRRAGRDGLAARRGDRPSMVEDVYVKPPWRGRGLGATVVRARGRGGVEQGAELVYLPTDADGAGAAVLPAAGVLRGRGRRAVPEALPLGRRVSGRLPNGGH